MNAQELRNKYRDFFKEKGHAWIPSSSLVPANDPTVLFTTAGMHPLVPYLLGERHPAGKRLASCQKCVRTGDIDEVGDDTHLTFFEMLGNWSLGDYFKKEAIAWSWEFLTDKKWLGIDPERLAFTCFRGDENATKDTESAEIWMSLGVKKEHIAFLGKEDNWWGPAGETGPCGPDTEMFYWIDNANPAPATFDTKDPRWVEIWNDVFMQYEKKHRTVLVDGMGCLYDENFQVNPELVNILQAQKGKKIIVVNGFYAKASEIAEALGFEAFSMEGRFKKEDKEFFDELLKHFDIELSGVLYIDHAKENIRGANAAGIKNTLLFEDKLDAVEKFIGEGAMYWRPLAQKNVDTGMGLERTLTALTGKKSVYETELFAPVLGMLAGKVGIRAASEKHDLRVMADHLRAAAFMIIDGAEPSNKDRGYVVRRLLRRSMVYARTLGMPKDWFESALNAIYLTLGPGYPELESHAEIVRGVISAEAEKFGKSLDKGMSEFNRIFNAQNSISGKDAFNLYQSYGFPWELTLELAQSKRSQTAADKDTSAISVDLVNTKKEFETEFEKHKNLSRTASAGTFKGGLADHSEIIVRYHTATHLLNAALRKVLGEHVMQKGSNITAERTRFDFSHPEKMTDEQKAQAEKLVNEWIARDLPVKREVMPLEDARKLEAIGAFGEKYPDTVSVYTVYDPKTNEIISREFCGGPHVTHTGEIGKSFRIIKEEASSAGVRRVKAVIE
jgi:HAD superfamily hydrolase (TIGR01509 family)